MATENNNNNNNITPVVEGINNNNNITPVVEDIEDVFTLDELSVRRGGGGGGHFNAKTRRLTLARKVLASVGDDREVYVVFGKSSRRAVVGVTNLKNGVIRSVHAEQCFITVPTPVAKAWGDSGDVAIEYRLGTAKA